MYGFLERWLADLLGLNYEPYTLGSGGRAAMVDKVGFEAAFNVLHKYHFEIKEDRFIPPTTISSDTVGMRVILCPYYNDFGIFEGLTDGNIKTTPDYLRMVEYLGSFNKTAFESFVKAGTAPVEEVTEETPKPKKKKPKPEQSEEEKFLIEIERNIGRTPSTSETNKKVFSKTNFPREYLFKLADQTGKHIVATGSTSIISALRKLDKALVQKYILVVFVKPGNTDKFRRQSTGIMPMVFGHELGRYYAITGGRSGGSAYSDYNMILKDTYTNTPFAVIDRSYIFLLFDYEYAPGNFAKLAMEEVGRRFDGKLSYDDLRKVDEKIYDRTKEENMEKYVDFSVQSVCAIKEELKKKYQHHESEYEKLFKQVLEHGKLMFRFREQYDAFDKSDIVSKEKERVKEEYKATMALENVEGLRIKDGRIHVFTKNLYARDPRTEKLHDIGTFHIQLGISDNRYSPDTSLKILNTKHLIKAYNSEGMQAPHVFTNGSVCHGGLAKGMIDAYSRRDVYQLILQLIIFLSQANVDDPAGKYIDKWPVVDEEALKKEKEGVKEEEKAEEKEFDEAVAEAITL